VVCCWFTPDYTHWVEPLIADLDKLGHPHDFRQVEPYGGWSWEKNTLRKAHEVGRVMDRWPDHWVIFVDVDARVLQPLNGLVDNFRGDVGFCIQTKYRRTGGVKLRVRSGTMIFAPTLQARNFVHVWTGKSMSAPRGEVDQTSLKAALGTYVAATFQPLPLVYCATAADRCHNPAILHGQASKGVRKIGKWRKRWWWLTGKR
jgi:hypothetical protein